MQNCMLMLVKQMISNSRKCLTPGELISKHCFEAACIDRNNTARKVWLQLHDSHTETYRRVYGTLHRLTS